MNELLTSFYKIESIQKTLTLSRFEHWIEYNLFSYQWWILLVIFIVPWIIWWRLLDQKRIIEILLYGVTSAHIIFVLDAIGKELTLWGYPYNLEPLLNRFTPVDTSALPVIYMLIYQYFPSWKTFLITHVLLAVIFSFIIEPILVWLEIYKLEHWKHIYSLPFYIIVPTLMKWMIEKVKLRMGSH